MILLSIIRCYYYLSIILSFLQSLLSLLTSSIFFLHSLATSNTTRKVYFTDRFFPTAFIRLEKSMNFATVLQILNFPTILKSNGKTVGI